MAPILHRASWISWCFTTSSGDLIKDGVLSAKIQLWKVEQNVKVNIGTYGDPAPGYCVSEGK